MTISVTILSDVSFL